MVVNEYSQMLRQLLPPGIALNPEYQDDVTDLIEKTAVELAEVVDLDMALFAEIDPRISMLLLAEWEASLGLPGKCFGNNQSITEKQAAAYEKLLNTGGARTYKYLNILKNLGYKDAKISRFTLHTCESDCEATTFSDTNWLFAWEISIPEQSPVDEFHCMSTCETPLSVWGNALIECVMNHEKQSHSHIIFKYTGTI